MKKSLRPVRHFDEALKKEAVSKIEKGALSPSGAAREHSVSVQTIYNWLYKYSRYLKKGDVVLVKKKDSTEEKQELLQRIAELERALGRKELETAYLNKLIEISSKELRVDIKKNLGKK